MYVVIPVCQVFCCELLPHFVTRNPSPDSRPSFPDVLVELQRPDFKLLTWTPEDVAAYSEQARTLGAPLEAGEELYTDIQKKYEEDI